METKTSTTEEYKSTILCNNKKTKYLKLKGGFFNPPFFREKEKIMTQLISPEKFTKTVDLLRSFFFAKRILEVHTQNRLSILAELVKTHSMLQHTIIRTKSGSTSPDRSNVVRTRTIIRPLILRGFFVSPLRIDKNQMQFLIRHDIIFPMFEFEMRTILMT